MYNDKKDINVLYMLQKFFNVGNITMHKDTANYQVVAMSDLVINNFRTF